ncbi:MAG: prepilin peptidase [Pirellulaceae bacterium]
MPSQRSPYGFWIAVAALVLLPLVYVVGLASWDMLEALRQTRAVNGFRFQPRIDYLLWDRAVEIGFGIWFFALGASVGSFLNVVAYRMPIGISLARSGSRCPRCRTPIRAQDNIPVFGWLALGGKCRACHLGISRRYPIIEGLTGAAFLLFYFARIAFGNRWLPGASPLDDAAVAQILLDGRWDILSVYLLHVVGFSLLWAATLMIHDDHAPPARFWWSAFIALPLLSTTLPWLVDPLTQSPQGWRFPLTSAMPLPAWPNSDAWPPSLENLVATLVGGGAGLGLGAISLLLARWLPEKEQLIDSSPDATAVAPPIETVAADERTPSEELEPRQVDSSTLGELSATGQNEPRMDSAALDSDGNAEVGRGGEGEPDACLEDAIGAETPEPNGELGPPPMLLDQPEPVVVGSAGAATGTWLGVAAIVGMTWGWQTLLMATPVMAGVVILQTPWIRYRHDAIRAISIGYCVAVLVIAPWWSFFVRPFVAATF